MKAVRFGVHGVSWDFLPLPRRDQRPMRLGMSPAWRVTWPLLTCGGSFAVLPSHRRMVVTCRSIARCPGLRGNRKGLLEQPVFLEQQLQGLLDRQDQDFFFVGVRLQ